MIAHFSTLNAPTVKIDTPGLKKQYDLSLLLPPIAAKLIPHVHPGRTNRDYTALQKPVKSLEKQVE